MVLQQNVTLLNVNVKKRVCYQGVDIKTLTKNTNMEIAFGLGTEKRTEIATVMKKETPSSCWKYLTDIEFYIK